MVPRNRYSALILRESTGCDRRIAQSWTTGVDVSNDDPSKRVTIRCAKGTVLELLGDFARMFGYFNSTVIRASDKKMVYPCLT